MTQLWRLDASGLADGFRRGDFTPPDALASCLERVAAVQLIEGAGKAAPPPGIQGQGEHINTYG